MSAAPPARIFRVLFLCSGNSARSQMAEALLNLKGKGRFRSLERRIDQLVAQAPS